MEALTDAYVSRNCVVAGKPKPKNTIPLQPQEKKLLLSHNKVGSTQTLSADFTLLQ
ncbi:UNVERIFIED_ORG: hypothetical protein J2Y78_004910 [Buttiauxella agrestis ATCC 33320]